MYVEAQETLKTQSTYYTTKWNKWQGVVPLQELKVSNADPLYEIRSLRSCHTELHNLQAGPHEFAVLSDPVHQSRSSRYFLNFPTCSANFKQKIYICL